jgi:hypothetical protein
MALPIGCTLGKCFGAPDIIFDELCVLRGEYLIPLPRDWWRYGDYPDRVGLCQFGYAFTMALTRRAVEHVLIPSNVI